MRGHGETVVGKSVREATVRTLYTHIDAQAQTAALALNPHITVMDAAELAFNATENFDADRPWQITYKQRLPAGRSAAMRRYAGRTAPSRTIRQNKRQEHALS